MCRLTVTMPTGQCTYCQTVVTAVRIAGVSRVRAEQYWILAPESDLRNMPSRLSRFTDRLVTLAKRSASGDPAPPVKKGDGGYADWVIVVIHGLREYLDLPYRRLLDVLHEMHGIGEKLNLEPTELPDFTTVCTRKQRLKMTVWQTLLRLSADLHDAGDVWTIDATGFDHHSPAVTTQTGQITPFGRNLLVCSNSGKSEIEGRDQDTGQNESEDYRCSSRWIWTDGE